MRTLAAVDTVHTAAAICDYLGDRIGDADEVVAVTVVPESDDSDPADDAPAGATPAPGSDAGRDGREALNVTSVRLAGVDVATELRRGDPAEALLAAAAEHDVDEVVLGAGAGVPDATDAPESTAADGRGSTVTSVLAGAARPVVVLPVAGL